MKHRSQDRLHAEAWVGDAVLTLYARCYILNADGAMDAEKSSRMTSNRFLSAFGEPTAVEARIGRSYEAEGLSGAFAMIESEILPRFLQQEQKRLHHTPRAKRPAPPQNL